MNREQRRAMGHNGHAQQAILQAAAAQQAPQPPMNFNVGPLVQLDQLICLTAAACPGTPAEAVDRACEIVAQATKHAMIGTVQKRIVELQAEHNAAVKAAESKLVLPPE